MAWALQESKYSVTPRSVQIYLHKKEHERWSSLLKDKKAGRTHISVDWNRWVDSDEEEDFNGFDLSQFQGGGGGGGMPGMGGEGGDMSGLADLMGGGGAGGQGMDMEMLQQMVRVPVLDASVLSGRR